MPLMLVYQMNFEERRFGDYKRHTPDGGETLGLYTSQQAIADAQYTASRKVNVGIVVVMLFLRVKTLTGNLVKIFTNQEIARNYSKDTVDSLIISSLRIIIVSETIF